MAKHWSDQGARRLHIVDLNGAVAGRPKNEKVIREMIKVVGEKTPIQLGGGSATWIPSRATSMRASPTSSSARRR
jgi:phosphoribosylformimino-5-aminoimidazole carboxamide ribonucleotide (ProFAR) isomerase